MQLTNWLASWLTRGSAEPTASRGSEQWGRQRTRRANAYGARLGHVPAAESLEPRTLPAVITVTSLADTVVNDGQVTLREAIQAANNDSVVDGSTKGSGADTIQFAAALTASGPATITLGGTQLTITTDLTINGPGADRLTIDADNRSRMFKVDDGTYVKANVYIGGLAMAKGRATDENNTAGAIWNRETLTITSSSIRNCYAQSIAGAIRSEQGELTISQSTIRDNASGRGAISVYQGTLTVTHSTISGNSTTTYGGAIDAVLATTIVLQTTIVGNSAQWRGGGILMDGGTLTVLQCTIARNFAASGGGAIYTFSGNNLTLHNTILIQNTMAGGQANDLGIFSGALVTARNNLISDPLTAGGLTNGLNGNIVGADNGFGGRRVLDATIVLNTSLASNGGPMKTLALVSGSPAINAGDNSRIPTDTLDVDGDGNSTEATPFDQRGSGFARVADSTVDIGAVEFVPASSQLSIAATNASRIEGNSGTIGFTFTVTRTDGSGTASVNYAVTGSGTNAANATDFGGTLPSGTVSFAAGESSKTITINVSGDTAVEPYEGFTVTLSSPVGVNLGTASAAGTIRNEDSAVSIAATSADQSEGNDGTTPFTFTVTRTGAVSGAASVDYVITGSGTNAVDADDFGGLLASGTVSFAATETSKIITLNVSGDTHVETDDEFVVTLSNVIGVGLGTSTATGVIRDDDGVPPVSMLLIAAASASVSEGNSGTTSLSFTVSRTFASGSASVDYAVAGRGTAAADATDFGGSFLSGTVNFASGETMATVVVHISGDARIERDEDFVVILSNPVGAALETASAEGTITNDDGVSNELANVLLDVSGKLYIRDFVIGGRVDRLVVGFDSVSQEFVIRDPQNALAASVGTVVDSHEIRVARSAVTGTRLIVDLNGGADLLDLSALPAGLVAVEVNGGDGNDTIIGHAGADSINGGTGNDSISARAGNDTLLGGDGNDVLKGEAGNDSLCGQMNNDRLLGGDGDDTGDGGGGDDSLSGDAGNDSLLGSTGNDLLNGGDGRDKLLGGDGRDSLNGNSGNDQLVGGLGHDAIDGGAGDDYLEGHAGNDSLNGSVGHDTLNGNQDADTLIGLSGDDRLDGGDGNDIAKGGDGNDTLLGGFGDDNLSGSIGNDVEDGGGGADSVAGGDGNDTLSGGDGHDYVHGDAGQDELHGNAGDDSLHGGTQNDVVFGDTGNDIVVGGENDDILWGGSDNDWLIGQAGTDQHHGESGTDTLTGGSEIGADATDTFVGATDDVFEEFNLVVTDWINRV